MKTTQKAPPADREQKKHLLARLLAKSQSLHRDWSNEDAPDEPAEVKAARKIVDDYEARQDHLHRKEREALNLVTEWHREQVLFRPAQEALELVKCYEMTTWKEAVSAGMTMADRNDAPIGMPTLNHG